LITAALTFSPKSAEDAILKPKKSGKGTKGHSRVLAPPMNEFDMLVTELKAKETETIKALQGPSIMIVTGGKGTFKAGGKEYEVKDMSFSLVMILRSISSRWMVLRPTQRSVRVRSRVAMYEHQVVKSDVKIKL
jgi:hypothetical protein